MSATRQGSLSLGLGPFLRGVDGRERLPIAGVQENPLMQLRVPVFAVVVFVIRVQFSIPQAMLRQNSHRPHPRLHPLVENLAPQIEVGGFQGHLVGISFSV
jgi:hypothetical protein